MEAIKLTPPGRVFGERGPAITLATPLGIEVPKGELYSYQLEAAGGAGELTWNIDPRTMFEGVSVSEKGLLSVERDEIAVIFVVARDKYGNSHARPMVIEPV